MALAILLILFSLSLSSPSETKQPQNLTSFDVAALLALKRSITLDPAGLLSGWNSSTATNHCLWIGITCDPVSGRVTGLNFPGTSSSRIAGNLPEAIGNLTELRTLSLRNNAFSGEIPAAVGGLEYLEFLDLRGNNFSGLIPNQMSSLWFVRVLDLAHNSLSGSIPEGLIGMSNLESLDLSFNQLSGEILISPFSSCKFLMHLKLSDNLFVNKIPPEIGKCTNLKTVLMNGNILEGRVPAEIGRISGLRVLDVSRNSLTDKIPRELGNCLELSVLVLTNLVGSHSSTSLLLESSTGDEFNAFVGVIPPEILLIPSLEILWAPRANVEGRLPDQRKGSCSLRVLNLGQNYLGGEIPEWIGTCSNLTFLDLSSNNLQGLVPFQLGVSCMLYANFSQNSLSGSLLETGCRRSLISDLPEEKNIVITYSKLFLQSARIANPIGSPVDNNSVVLHDFSWNNFSGPLPPFSFPFDRNITYGLYLNNNGFNGSLSADFFASCNNTSGFAVNLSFNRIWGEIGMLSSCPELMRFEASNNLLTGPIPSGTMASLIVLDLARNSLTGIIPSTLANSTNLEALLLDHNRLSGKIPPSLAALSRLLKLDVSYNNLSGDIPHLKHPSDCEFFKGNYLLRPCRRDSIHASSSMLPSLAESANNSLESRKMTSFMVASMASASVVLSLLIMLVLVLVCRRRKLVWATSPRKVVVTFTDTPAEVTYENVVRATGNYSLQNLIGTGGFGATYKAELVPGYLVAVKRLSMGRFQGLQQFDAEIRTLGRIRHKNLVTLIGYHNGENDAFLIYNYLSGGNLETFIQNVPGGDVRWPVIHKIALDIAQALAYLHYSCAPRILHRDIKPSNILLDEKLNAYLSDFGLARLLEVSQTHATTDVAGTFGYVAPEYATTCRVSDKADVYSFGVVLLELISGKRSLDRSFSEYGNGFNIVAWGRLLIKEERAGELFPPALWEAGPKEKLVRMLRLALACTVEALPVRPSMKQVVDTLKQLKG